MADETTITTTESTSEAAPVVESWQNQPLGDNNIGFEGNSDVIPESQTDTSTDEGTPVEGEGDAAQAQPVSDANALTAQEADLAKAWGISDEQLKNMPADAIRTINATIASRFVQPEQPAPSEPNGQQQAAQQQAQQQEVPTLTPESFRLDLSKLPEFAELDEVAQKPISAVVDHMSTVVHDVVTAFSQRNAALEQAINSLIGQNEHRYMESVLSGLGDEWKDVAKSYLGLTPEAFKAREQLRSGYYGMRNAVSPNGQPLSDDAIFKSLLHGLHGAEIAKAAQQKRQESLKKNDRMLAQHAAGPGSSRRVASVKSDGMDAAYAAAAEILGR